MILLRKKKNISELSSNLVRNTVGIPSTAPSFNLDKSTCGGMANIADPDQTATHGEV